MGATPRHSGEQQAERQEVTPSPNNDLVHETVLVKQASEPSNDLDDREKQLIAEGEAKFHRLGWKRMAIVLIVEAIALGTLSLPAVFSSLGMFLGIVFCIFFAFLSWYTSYVVGIVKCKFPHVTSYPQGCGLMWGKWGDRIVYAMLASQLTLLLGSHVLTGAIALATIVDNNTCTIVWSVVSAIIMLVAAIPPSFAEVAILGYIDFASIIAAVFITIIGTGVQAKRADGGLSAVDWSWWPRDGVSFTDGFIGCTNIVFAYSFVLCQFSFMDEMHTLPDFSKSIAVLEVCMVVIYTLAGASIYAFVGKDVKSPALLSGSANLAKTAFGIALPVIYISGSINTTVLGKMIVNSLYADSPIKYINTPAGWTVWLTIITALTIIAFVIAEVIPFFSDLLSVCSSLFVSGFSYYFPPCMWYWLLREGPPFNKKNWFWGLTNLVSFIIGVVIFVAGTYASIDDIRLNYKHHTVNGVFSCDIAK